MRTWLLLLLLAVPLLAQGPLSISSIDWGTANAAGGQRIKARITLTGPAPEGGARVIFEPTFHLELPSQVVIPAGQTSAEFLVPIVDNRLFSNYGFTSVTSRSGGGFSDQTTVTALMNGQTWEGPGPQVNR